MARWTVDGRVAGVLLEQVTRAMEDLSTSTPVSKVYVANRPIALLTEGPQTTFASLPPQCDRVSPGNLNRQLLVGGSACMVLTLPRILPPVPL